MFSTPQLDVAFRLQIALCNMKLDDNNSYGPSLILLCIPDGQWVATFKLKI